jgi:hypothetical protein
MGGLFLAQVEKGRKEESKVLEAKVEIVLAHEPTRHGNYRR